MRGCACGCGVCGEASGELAILRGKKFEFLLLASSSSSILRPWLGLLIEAINWFWRCGVACGMWGGLGGTLVVALVGGLPRPAWGTGGQGLANC